ncbi:YihY/virulence factor BrkB family protein [Porphyrobacter sp. GA68]|uniref:YihY/virulence factor BrkB family protein n=1 Tax=Porphyrobacter sp. GA68 TaxID=2883480 RepID=UPI001D192208|nr:YihY/virulence factor BrkB family protein [Porphyrobacter sp. GA68]
MHTAQVQQDDWQVGEDASAAASCSESGSVWKRPAGEWVALLKRVYKETTDDHLSIVAAGVAFYSLLALFPAIAALISLAGLVFDPLQILEQMQRWAANLPESAADIIRGQGESLAQSAGSALSFAFIGGVILSLYSASKGAKTLMEGLNVAYDVDETRNFLALNLRAFALTLMLIVGLILVAGLGIVLPFITDALRLPAGADLLIGLLRWVFLAGIVIAGLAVLYQYGPARADVPWRWVTPGAVLAVVLLVTSTALFGFYVGNFGNYNETYGTLGGVVILLTWLWLSSYIILLGAELNSQIERED